MKQILEEYGGVIIGVISALAMLVVIGMSFFSPGQGFLWLLVLYGNGGC